MKPLSEDYIREDLQGDDAQTSATNDSGSERQSAPPWTIMTAEEYATMNILGWHEVCRNFDGPDNIAVRLGNSLQRELNDTIKRIVAVSIPDESSDAMASGQGVEIRLTAGVLWCATLQQMPYTWMANSSFALARIGQGFYETEKEAISAARELRIAESDRLWKEICALDDRIAEIELKELDDESNARR